MRCFKKLVEAVIMESTRTSEVAVLAFFINHVDARVYVNIPLDTDPRRLQHIANAYKDTNVGQLRQLSQAIVASIIKYPTRIVVETKFQVQDSIFNSDLTNSITIRKLNDRFAEALG